ncbi:hypothetical protein [Hymenobacter sp. BRD67]|uniref:hypothetical protein n=1 Tax=Hymenobacter sp. BRD67 TaxID=2675877 RepID=UPI0015630850|nr:hypothetical protein [Hymenobacter sp. BRD67]QKG54027.1 hypothetical protein GKZ67_17235 [Hymenobacter sp. BRD67]
MLIAIPKVTGSLQLGETGENLKPYAPDGHKKTASDNWGGNRQTETKKAKRETQNECKPEATADRPFRKTACLAVSCFIHWCLSAFTVQNYQFFFRRNVTFSEKTFLRFPTWPIFCGALGF